MKEVNLVSIVQAYQKLSESNRGKYFACYSISPKENEIRCTANLVNNLKIFSPDSVIFNGYFFGYQIPQISKEFDLLRFGEKYIVNIELKSTFTDTNKITHQLTRNKYYLTSLNTEVYCFTFVSDECKLYSINDSNTLFESDFGDLINLLSEQEFKDILNVDKLFDPSNYLVSPFNSTRKFVYGNYFLTSQQEEIKCEVNKLLSKGKTSFICITGKAGTGKTLLTYDIVRDLISENKDVLIVHCGMLNEGQESLIKNNNWNIISIKYLGTEDLSNYSLVVIDETQRIYKRQLDDIISDVKKNNISCIFSYDSVQCLRRQEIKNNIPEIIKNKTNPSIFKLTEKIRTNKDIATFTKSLFDPQRILNKIVDKSCIHLNYFGSYHDANDYISFLANNGCKMINYTSSLAYKLPYDKFALELGDNAHEVIGQEYDSVVAVLDSYFYYTEDRLSTRNYSRRPYYHPSRMLFQIITRAKKELNIIIVNNEPIMERCLNILNA